MKLTSIRTTRRFWLLLIAPSILLLIPAIAMLFTKEVNWSLLDFIVAAVILYGAALGVEWICRKVQLQKKRILWIGLLLVLLVLVWLELAVGIFHSFLAGN